MKVCLSVILFLNLGIFKESQVWWGGDHSLSYLLITFQMSPWKFPFFCLPQWESNGQVVNSQSVFYLGTFRYPLKLELAVANQLQVSTLKGLNTEGKPMELSQYSVGPWSYDRCSNEVFKQITEGTNHKGKDQCLTICILTTSVYLKKPRKWIDRTQVRIGLFSTCYW